MNSKITIKSFQDLPIAKKMLFREPPEKRPFHLHCTLLDGGHETLEAGKEYFFDGLKRGNRYFCNLQFCLAGRGKLEYEGEIHTLNAGDLFITEVPHDHRYYLPQAAVYRNHKQDGPEHKQRANSTSSKQPATPAWEFVYLTLTGSEVQRIVPRILEMHQSPVLGLSYGQSRLLQRILNSLLVQGLEDIFYYSGMVYQLLLDMLSEKINAAQIQEFPMEIRRMQEFIYANYSQNIGVPDISKQSGLSENYAMRLFKERTGKTIHQFVEEVRLAQAQNLLQYTIRNIKEVAQMVGFSDHNYFIRVFRRQFGITPGKYRKL